MSKRDEVIEKIVKEVEITLGVRRANPITARALALDTASYILSIEGLEILDDDQNTPENPYSSNANDWLVYAEAIGFMLKDNWVKVLPK